MDKTIDNLIKSRTSTLLTNKKYINIRGKHTKTSNTTDRSSGWSPKWGWVVKKSTHRKVFSTSNAKPIYDVQKMGSVPKPVNWALIIKHWTEGWIEKDKTHFVIQTNLILDKTKWTAIKKSINIKTDSNFPLETSPNYPKKTTLSTNFSNSSNDLINYNNNNNNNKVTKNNTQTRSASKNPNSTRDKKYKHDKSKSTVNGNPLKVKNVKMNVKNTKTTKLLNLSYLFIKQNNPWNSRAEMPKRTLGAF